MTNEWEEFCAYTGTVFYTASKKSDTTWLGRFTFATILEFEGMARILTILARGYLFHSITIALLQLDSMLSTHDSPPSSTERSLPPASCPTSVHPGRRPQ